ncbi:MAG: Asp/Glu racemase [Pseudomonadota bacterium]
MAERTDMRLSRVLAEFDPVPRPRFGLVSLASDPVASDEIRAVLGGPSRAVHETRIANSDRIDLASLGAMEAGLTAAARLLPVPEAYDAVGYLCTSASMVIGSDRVAELIEQSVPGAAVTDPMRATMRALVRLGARRIGVVTPYVPEVTQGIIARLKRDGVAVAGAVSFEVGEDSRVARISADAIRSAIEAVSGDAEAVFVSCTALRTTAHIARWEAEIGLPVVSSNQAIAWHLLDATSIAPAPGSWGRLLSPAISR